MGTTPDFGIPSLTTLLAVAAMFLGLALIVQVLQDLFKYLANSKAKVYHMVLKDFFGPWVDQLYEAGPAARFQVRGPFQFFKSQPTGVLLPLAKEELLEAIDSVAPDWLGHTLEALKNERRLQRSGTAKPSPGLETLVGNLAAAAEKEKGPSNARRMLEFLKRWEVVDDSGELVSEPVDAGRLLEGFYQRFFPERVRAEQEFGQLERNYQHAYDRRNLRYTFILGLLVAVLFNFPFNALYGRASALSPEEAIALADTMLETEKRIAELPALDVVTDGEGDGGEGGGEDGDGEDGDGGFTEEELENIRIRRELIEDLVDQIDPTLTGEQGEPIYQRGWEAVTKLWSESDGRRAKLSSLSSYFFNCLVTALLISFGAPFWHRLTEALLNVKRRKPVRPEEE